jgi:hypothetical protein
MSLNKKVWLRSKGKREKILLFSRSFLHEKSGKKSLKRLEKQGEKQEGKQEQS